MINTNLHTTLLALNDMAIRTRHVVSGFVCMGIFILSAQANAQGVLAGTNVQNIATVTYEIANTAQGPIESSPNGNNISGVNNGQSTDFLVDRKIDLLVTGNANSTVTPGDTQAEVTFTLVNEGNSAQEFNLLLDNLITVVDDFDSNSCTKLITGVTGIPLSTAGLIAPGNIRLSPDQQATISVRCDIPTDNSGAAILNGQTALVSLIATAVRNDDGTTTTASTGTDNSNAIETVYVDGQGSDDFTRDAMHSDRRTYTASVTGIAPSLTMNKTIQSMIHPSGDSNTGTGSEVTYKIQVNTVGTGTIENLIITDPTPADMTYKAESIVLNSVSQTDLDDAITSVDNSNFTANTATINLGDFVAGSQYEILITYIIN